MNLFEKLDEFNVNCNKNFMYSEIINLENGRLIYSNAIEDYYWNYITSIKVNSKEEFEKVWENDRKYLIDRNRIPALYITPSSNILNNYEKILPEYMKIQSKEIWMVFDNFDNLKSFESNKTIEIQIQNTNDLKLFADIFMESYSSDSKEDPYGQMPEYYRDVIINYDSTKTEYVKNFYVVKHKNIGIACALTVVKDEVALIGFVGTIKEYRNKGICKTLMNKVLNDLKEKKVKIAYLQTEEGFVPEKLYASIGFKIISTGIIAVEENREEGN